MANDVFLFGHGLIYLSSHERESEATTKVNLNEVTTVVAKIQQEYDKDFYAWTIHNAQLIRQGKFSEVDLEHVAEEIESMGKSDRRELISRFAVLLAHLLKWKFQPEKRSNSWENTIKTQRFDVSELLMDSPSLNYELDKQIEYAYEKALLVAVNETGLSQNTFPKTCPFSLSECFDREFFPPERSEES